MKFPQLKAQEQIDREARRKRLRYLAEDCVGAFALMLAVYASLLFFGG